MDLSKVDPSHKETEPFLGLGRLAPFQYERSAHETRIRIFWQRVVYWLIALVPVAWIFFTSGLYFFVKYRNGYTEVRYSHMLLLPIKLKEYRREKAEFFMAAGKKLFAEKDYLTGYELMRIALGSVPEDTEARRILADLYLAIRRPDLAQTLMVGGLPYNVEQLDYLQWVFASLFRFQEDDAVVRIAKDFLASVPDASPNARHVALMAEATAHVFRARYEEAAATLRREGTDRTPDGQLLLARIAFERGNNVEGEQRLRAVLRQNPDNLFAYVELSGLLRRERRHDEFRRLALLRELAFPEQPDAFLDELIACHDTGDDSGLAKAFAEYLTRFASNEAAMQKLAGFVSNSGRVDLARRLHESRATLPLPAGTTALCLIESQIVAHRYGDALAAIQHTVSVDRSLPDASERGVDALKAVAFYAQGDTLSAQGALAQYLGQANARADLLVLTAQRLEALGATELALPALRKAVDLDPLNQAAFNRLITLDPSAFKAEELRQSLPKLLALRQPPTELLRRVREELESDCYLFLPERQPLMKTLAQVGL